MRILIADAVIEDRVEALRERGHECVVDAGLDAAGLPAALAGTDPDALVVRSTRVTVDALDAGRRLALIIRAGAGTDTIDVAEASCRGVYVCTVPGRNAVAVAELAMALLLAVDRGVADAASELRGGHWDKPRYSAGRGLYGRTLAIVGVGNIGLATAERAAAFGMNVVVSDTPRAPDIEARLTALGARRASSTAELLAGADAVSIHVPSGPGTHHLVDDGFLSLLPDGAVVINTSRGDVVDEGALIRALDERSMRAGLDVFADEPAGTGVFDSPLARHERVVGTHHIGASTAQAQEAVADGVVEIVDGWMSGEVVGCVNVAERQEGSRSLLVRHLDRVGVLASILLQLRTRGVNVKQMSNEVFAGNVAAVARIHVEGEITAELVAAIDDIDEVIGVTVTRV